MGLWGAGTPPVVTGDVDTIRCDVAVVGSGMGGGTVAWALRDSGLQVLVVERGDFLPREEANSSPAAVFGDHRYATDETWVDGRTGRPFTPGVYYWVGGCTKVYGACLPRFRAEDFTGRRLEEGPGAAWPIGYDDLEPYYGVMEAAYGVHGGPGDPTEPPRSTGYPYPPVPHEPEVARLAGAFERQGLHPFPAPQGVDLRDGGLCRRCRTCDGFPCRDGAKSDAETCGIRPALRGGSVRLLTRTRVERLGPVESPGRVRYLEAVRDGRPVRIHADRFVLAAGAVNTAVLLLRSGVEDASGQLGRNYMVHNSTFMVGLDPRRVNGTFFQKTLMVNDWYHGVDGGFPLGNLQLLGKLQGSMVAASYPWVPERLLTAVMRRSMDVYLTTEDLPRPDNRVELDSARRIVVHWRPTNTGAHRELVRRAARALRRAGYPLVLTRRMRIDTNSHQCGTARMGRTPQDGVVTPEGRVHSVENLWVADAATFCGSAAVNPALTVGALALRLVDRAGWAPLPSLAGRADR